MEKEKKYMVKYSDTLLEDWVHEDSGLLKLLEEIELQAESDCERAEIAFHKLAEKYSLPKYPDDCSNGELEDDDDNDFQDLVSMYEVLGKLKFANPDPLQIKSNVLLAAYLVKNDYEPMIDDELEKYLAGDELAGLGFKGEGIAVEMIPIRKGESWFDKGCTLFIKKV
jgi:hypothetical protein